MCFKVPTIEGAMASAPRQHRVTPVTAMLLTEEVLRVSTLGGYRSDCVTLCLPGAGLPSCGGLMWEAAERCMLAVQCSAPFDSITRLAHALVGAAQRSPRVQRWPRRGQVSSGAGRPACYRQRGKFLQQNADRPSASLSSFESAQVNSPPSSACP